MAKDDLLEHARTTIDYYGLLSLNPDALPTELSRAYRKASLKHHPDKGGNPETFHLLTIAYNVLSDETAKAIYDQGLQAKIQKAKKDALFEGKRRAMKEDLERREREGGTAFGAPGYGAKREREVDVNEELARLKALGKKRRMENEEKRRVAELLSRGIDGETVSLTDNGSASKPASQAEPQTQSKPLFAPSYPSTSAEMQPQKLSEDDRINQLEAQLQASVAAKAQRKADKKSRKSGFGTPSTKQPSSSHLYNQPSSHPPAHVPSGSTSQASASTPTRPSLFSSLNADASSASSHKFTSFAPSPPPAPNPTKKDDGWEAIYEKLREAEKKRLTDEIKLQEASQP